MARSDKTLYAVTPQGRVEEILTGTWADVNRGRAIVEQKNARINQDSKLKTTVYDKGGWRCAP
jgi:hypothetical protein